MNDATLPIDWVIVDRVCTRLEAAFLREHKVTHVFDHRKFEIIHGRKPDFGSAFTWEDAGGSCDWCDQLGRLIATCNGTLIASKTWDRISNRSLYDAGEAYAYAARFCK
jgi:hypothetical protein